MEKREAQVIAQTQQWLQTVVIEQSFCPFAKREVLAQRVRYAVIGGVGMANALHAVVEEFECLNADKSVETTLLIFPDAFQRFDEYLDLLAVAEELVIEQGYEGVYQVASFHPDYQFDGTKEDDAENYTNRSPYPMLHLLREASVEQALKAYSGDPDDIPERNIDHARTLGALALRELLEAAFTANGED